jgi:uncharacterized membrane protein
VLTTVAVSAGFIALAFPLEADASWIALGWAAEGAVLWWFGQRVSAPALRLIAAGLAGAAIVRVIGFDLPPPSRQLFVPLFNAFALPALGVGACLLGAVASTQRFVARCHVVERYALALATGVVLIYVWFILSIECYGYFRAIARMPESDAQNWRWLGQMAVSILGAVYASVLLGIGFWKGNVGLRGLAMLIYAVTVAKVFAVDMRESSYLYRVFAFFVLALLIGAAAWAYQRIQTDRAVEGVSGAGRRS